MKDHISQDDFFSVLLNKKIYVNRLQKYNMSHFYNDINYIYITFILRNISTLNDKINEDIKPFSLY